MVYVNQFFLKILYQLRKLYLNSNFYDKKISNTDSVDLVYKPSPHLLSSLIKYQKKRIRIEDFSLDKIWSNNNLSFKDYRNLNNFYWFLLAGD